MLKQAILNTVALASALPCAAEAKVEAQSTQSQATIIIAADEPAKTYDPMIFGGFIEHLGKQIYGGFFEPGSPLADAKGFRLDVIKAVKELKVPVRNVPPKWLPLIQQHQRQ